MIQRIQTLWLVLAVVCLALCFVFPVAKYQFVDMPTEGQLVEARLDLVSHGGADMLGKMEEPVIEYGQSLTGMKTWPMTLLVAFSGAIALLSIFLFRNRVAQMRIVSLGFIVNLVYIVLVFVWAVDKYADLLSAGMGGAKPDVSWSIGAFMPILSLAFFFLAQRAIKKDEALVRAADRLR